MEKTMLVHAKKSGCLFAKSQLMGDVTIVIILTHHMLQYVSVEKIKLYLLVQRKLSFG